MSETSTDTTHRLLRAALKAAHLELDLTDTDDGGWELGTEAALVPEDDKWQVVRLDYYPGGFDHRSGDGEPPSYEPVVVATYEAPEVVAAVQAAVLLVVGERVKGALEGLALTDELAAEAEIDDPFPDDDYAEWLTA